MARLDANPERSRATVLLYRSMMKNHVWPEMGDVRVQDLTAQQVADHLGLLASRPSKRHPQARVNGVTPNVAIALRSCLNAAVKAKAGGLDSFTFPEAPKHRRVRPEDEHGDVATPEEVRVLTAAMPARLGITVPLAAWCALRLGEVLGLERRDLEHLDDPGKAVLHVRRQFQRQGEHAHPAGSRQRPDHRHPCGVASALRQHLDAYTPAARTGSVLAGPSGQRVSQTTLDRHWRAARAEAGRPGFHFHNLRHTGLSAYAVQGATLAELLHRGGHTDVTVALRYQHATAARERALTERLSKEIAL